MENSIKPITEAAKTYEGSNRNFTNDLAEYLAKGYVYSGEDAFIMARTLRVDQIEQWNDLDSVHIEPDCWFVFLAAGKGSIHRFQELAPFELPFIAWHRRGSSKPKIYRWDKFRRKTKNGIS